MNIAKTTLCLLALTVFTTAVVTVRAENQPSEKAPLVRSVYVVPTSSNEGRDPFFPESTRLSKVVATTKPKDVITDLIFHGISGPPEHLLAIINNHTFAKGDEGDVLTESGKIHLRCIEIQPGAVTVEINGRTHQINMEKQK